MPHKRLKSKFQPSRNPSSSETISQTDPPTQVDPQCPTNRLTAQDTPKAKPQPSTSAYPEIQKACLGVASSSQWSSKRTPLPLPQKSRNPQHPNPEAESAMTRVEVRQPMSPSARPSRHGPRKWAPSACPNPPPRRPSFLIVEVTHVRK